LGDGATRCGQLALTDQNGGKPMTEPYRTFHVNGGVQPNPETLLGRTTSWYATGSIEFRRRDHSVTELTRFRLPGMTFEEEEVAARFGLELARMFVDVFYRDFVIQRYEIEKRRTTGNAISSCSLS
jgi:hypothetical protein